MPIVRNMILLILSAVIDSVLLKNNKGKQQWSYVLGITIGLLLVQL